MRPEDLYSHDIATAAEFERHFSPADKLDLRDISDEPEELTDEMLDEMYDRENERSGVD